MKSIATFFFLFMSVCTLVAQDCAMGENLIIIRVQTDQYGAETSWNIVDGQGTELASGDDLENFQLYEDSLCVASGSCLTFTIFDSFGDGFTGDGMATVEFDGTLIASISSFESSQSTSFDCTPGQSCEEAITIGEETLEFVASGEWFSFTPIVNGIYKISTCDDVICDTKIWVYDGCDNLLLVDGHEGTTFFGDDGDCGVQAEVSGIMIADDEYWIRVRSEDPSCNGDMISVSFVSAIIGCTNPDACNYNPLATEDDGSCDLTGESCPKPDLLIDLGALKSTLMIRQKTNDDECLINEGCMRGYGVRDIISFRTVIANVGDADFFVGQPEENPDQFDFDNCHDHYHYGGYAEYVLYDEFGQYIPIGFKNGFCVIDLNCPSQDMYKYSCNFMGISAGCIDIYDENLACQWIDITDIPDGNYTFVTRVNWDNSPDALGQLERDSINNWAQVCIQIDRSLGQLSLSQVEDCDPYVDCLGNIYGKAEIDCKGDCNGTALRGDLDGDNELSGLDRVLYADQALEEIEATSCSDLNSDGRITVYDAAMLTNCMLYGDDHTHVDGTAAHDHCTFPAGIYNETTPVQFEISEVTSDYFVLALRNSSSDILAYQFRINGVKIESLENLVDDFTAEAMMKSDNTNHLLVMSESNSYIPKSAVFNPILKVYYSNPSSSELCVESIDFVNVKYEQLDSDVDIDCVSLEDVSTLNYSAEEITVYPNPFANTTYLELDFSDQYILELYDASGRLVRSISFQGNSYIIEQNNLLEGLYFMSVKSDKIAYRTKLVIQ